MPPGPIVAAGGVVIRGGAVLLVHRPRYDDWSFPKGKLDRGEHLTTCAVREVREETGLDIRLSAPLPPQFYPVGRRDKVVHYWLGHVVGTDATDSYVPNDEIDQVAWVPLGQAESRLTHPRDRATLADAIRTRTGSGGRIRTLVVLRHGQARARSSWPTDDRYRPLLVRGELQARRVAPVLAAYDVRQMVSSSSTRCVATLDPYADLTHRRVEALEELSEESATSEQVRHVVRALLAHKPVTVLCSHRPVLPMVFDTLGLVDPALAPGEMLVVHHRNGRVLATERHLP